MGYIIFHYEKYFLKPLNIDLLSGTKGSLLISSTYPLNGLPIRCLIFMKYKVASKFLIKTSFLNILLLKDILILNLFLSLKIILNLNLIEINDRLKKLRFSFILIVIIKWMLLILYLRYWYLCNPLFLLAINWVVLRIRHLTNEIFFNLCDNKNFRHIYLYCILIQYKI